MKNYKAGKYKIKFEDGEELTKELSKTEVKVFFENIKDLRIKNLSYVGARF